MSYAPRHSAAYMEILTPVFADDYPHEVQNGSTYYTGSEAIEYHMLQQLQSLPWHRRGLMRKTIADPQQGDDVVIVEKHIAENLLQQAFLDAKAVIAIGAATLQDHEVGQGRYADILHRSSHLPAPILRLGDKEAGKVLGAMESADISPQASTDDLDSDYFVRPMEVHEDEGRQRLAWRGPMLRHLNNLKGDDTGCPAHKVIVETAVGQRQTLVQHLWHTIISADY